MYYKSFTTGRSVPRNHFTDKLLLGCGRSEFVVGFRFNVSEGSCLFREFGFGWGRLRLTRDTVRLYRTFGGFIYNAQDRVVCRVFDRGGVPLSLLTLFESSVDFAALDMFVN